MLAEAEAWLTNVVTGGWVAVAVMTIVTDWPIPRVEIFTSTLLAVKLGVPAVEVTFVTVSHAGKSVSLTSTPRAPKLPVLDTVNV